MPFPRLRAIVLIVAFASTALTGAAIAQSPNRKESTASAAISGFYQAKSDLDGGGSTSWGGVILAGSWGQQVTPQLELGLTLRYDYQNWSFTDPVAFAGAAPWKSLNLISVGMSVDYVPASDLRLGVIPVFGWSYETGAGAGNVLDYGAILSVTRIFSPGLVLGGGVGVFRQIDETKVFPFVILQWQIDERWRLANPFRAGPAGGAGLELAYTLNDRWELAGGGTYRSYRFRLDDAGIAAGGVGENRLIPLFARVSHKLTPQTKLDVYAGVSVSGRVAVTDTRGHETSADYKAAPALGVTLSHRF